MTTPNFDRAVSLVGLHVLIVDDHDDSREVLSTVLRVCGARVSQASSARVALRMVLEGARPDVVVTDLQMPNEDGYWLLREIVTHLGHRIPVVAITGNKEYTRRRALSAGFSEHVPKPVDAWALCRIVGALSGHSAA
jgi:CheY-like chemotaxis protein